MSTVYARFLLACLVTCMSTNAFPNGTQSETVLSRQPSNWSGARRPVKPSGHDLDQASSNWQPVSHWPAYHWQPKYPQSPRLHRQPEYPQSPKPHRQPEYPRRPEYPDQHDAYPGRERCRDGRPCGDRVNDDLDDQSGYLGCSCFLYVEYTVVFRRVNNEQRFSCNRYGLDRCCRYCEQLFQDEGLRTFSRQEACDVLGREVHTPWYQKNQVCGGRGPYKDIHIPDDLCCRKGRTSLSCSNE